MLLYTDTRKTFSVFACISVS